MDAPPIGRRPTIIDLARAAGVSKSTVSLVLNGSDLVRAETRRRVEAAVEALGYVYNRGAASLRAGSSDIIGMVINDLANPFFADLARGIERTLQARGVTPFIADSGEDPERQTRGLRKMYERGAVGFIVSAANGSRVASFETFARLGAPVVLAVRPVAGASLPLVAPDNRRGAEAATAHLVALGHRRIAFLGGRAGMVVHEDRLAGYRAALAAHGLDAGRYVVDCDLDRAAGAEALVRALAAGPAPTAALCYNDRVAIGAMHALWERGLVPGRDFAVIGFDDIEEARWARPALTTVAIDAEGLGRRAAARLLAEIDGTAGGDDGLAPARLVVRESCGASPQRRHQQGASG